MTTTEVAPAEPVASSEASRRTHKAARRLPKLPRFVARLCFLAAFLLLLHVIFPGVFWVSVLIDAFSTIVFPIDGGSLGLVVGLVIVGGALARRKRIGWIIAIVFGGIVMLGDLLTIVLIVGISFAGYVQFIDLATLARAAFNLASVGTLLSFLIVYRSEFSARRQPGNVVKALVTLLVGLALTVGVGFLLTTLFPSDLTGPRGRLGWIVTRIVDTIVGDFSALEPSPAAPPTWINTVIGLMIALTLIAALLVLLRSQRRAAWMSPNDEPRVRALVAQSPDDSLAYFNTRHDKSVVFSTSGRAAVSYRVGLGVCLASSDPIGPPDHWPGAIEAWFYQIEQYGWTPAVIGASEAGATAYAKAGLKVLRLGDEAVLQTREFHLDSHDMRAVRASVQRLDKLGYHTRVRRHRDIPADELQRLIGKTDAWRDTESERGFSMALGRLGDPADGDCMMVEAIFPPDRAEPGAGGEVAGILSFVPWGSDGFSLDVMRRSPRADNGVTELLVTALMAAGRELGIRRVSLNFAVFRSAFEEGARIGAGPSVRILRRLLLVASRWWQIESLFRSNVKYRPIWKPRFLCFSEARDIALVGLASGVAEGFIDLPGFLSQHQTPPPRPPGTPLAAELITAQLVAAKGVGPRLPEQTRLRMQRREQILAAGGDPYPVTFRPTRPCAELRLGEQASVAGRVMAVRDLGGVIFVSIQDWSGHSQLLLSADVAGEPTLATFRRMINIGDHVGAEGTMVMSRSGEPSLEVRVWCLTAKSLRPLPDKHRGIADPEARVRQRYLDLTMNAAARKQLIARSAGIRAVRETLQTHGFMEVETPILQTIHGGANARPFRTHINAYDLELYLRIAPELYLKRLLVGGVDRLFEIGRNFRNEGADATHNPEFTMLEAYEAYGDYTTMRVVAQNLITAAARAATSGTVVIGTDYRGQQHEVDLAGEWRVTTVNAAISAAAGVEITADTEKPELLALADRLQINVDDNWTRGNVLLELYEHLVEHRTVAPTFYCDFPAEVSPLTRAHRDDPRLAERWDLVAFGAEIGTAYSELIDPVEQRARLTAQSLQAAGGDPEAMELDEDFLVALEYAMPPTGGLGMGIDRVIMMLTNTTIRETIAFPLVRPRT
jgi:lysyl-tRNA synthetase, class II